MRSVRLSLLALVAAVSAAVLNTGHADSIAAPLAHPVHVRPDVPPQVSVAIVALRKACVAWPAKTVALPKAAGTAPQPVAAQGPAPQERTLCDLADNPDQVFLQPMIVGAIGGAILFPLGFVFFCCVRGSLISLWNWRLLRRTPLPYQDWTGGRL
jgi:hypothetical protein